MQLHVVRYKDIEKWKPFFESEYSQAFAATFITYHHELKHIDNYDSVYDVWKQGRGGDRGTRSLPTSFTGPWSGWFFTLAEAQADAKRLAVEQLESEMSDAFASDQADMVMRQGGWLYTRQPGQRQSETVPSGTHP